MSLEKYVNPEKRGVESGTGTNQTVIISHTLQSPMFLGQLKKGPLFFKLLGSKKEASNLQGCNTFKEIQVI